MIRITAILEQDADGTVHLPLDLRNSRVRVTATLEADFQESERASREAALAALKRLRERGTFREIFPPSRPARGQRPFPCARENPRHKDRVERLEPEKGFSTGFTGWTGLPERPLQACGAGMCPCAAYPLSIPPENPVRPARIFQPPDAMRRASGGRQALLASGCDLADDGRCFNRRAWWAAAPRRASDTRTRAEGSGIV